MKLSFSTKGWHNINFEDFCEFFNLEAESESISVGGWVMELFGRIPEEGATETSGMFTVTILESDEQSVSKVGIKLDMPKDNS